ncbi:MAG TPA: hypothetical protein VEK33_04295 [Terriglobales bacterium]|nr:hypothetical protein [Terriglobales bacterium]
MAWRDFASRVFGQRQPRRGVILSSKLEIEGEIRRDVNQVPSTLSNLSPRLPLPSPIAQTARLAARLPQFSQPPL